MGSYYREPPRRGGRDRQRGRPEPGPGPQHVEDQGEIPGNGIDDDDNGYVDDVNGWNTYADTPDITDDSLLSHGTHVAGIIGAVGDDGNDVAGLAWNVSLMAIKFTDPSGSGFVSDAIAGMEYVAIMKERGVKVDIVNQVGSTAVQSQALRDAIEAHLQLGIIHTVSASNGNGADNDKNPRFPANFANDLPNVISVTATTRTDARAFYSNVGKQTVSLTGPLVMRSGAWSGQRTTRYLVAVRC